MPSRAAVDIRQLGPADHARFEKLMSVFGEAFNEPETYTGARPPRGYVERLLGNPGFIALAALRDDEIVGGIAAYELPKFERERSEIYVYDLAVAAAHRRRGIATALIEAVRRIAADRGAWVVFVQADRGDEPAIRLYTKLGTPEDVINFDIGVPD